MNNINITNQVENEIDIKISKILALIRGNLPIFPITIMTSKTRGQVEVKTKDEMIKAFIDASLKDCRINAYPVYTGYNGLNTTKKAFIMIDLDLNNFLKYKNPKSQLELSLKRTLEKLSAKINSNPMVLLTGGGYHIYQPIYFEDMLTSIAFNKHAQYLNQTVTNLFMRFAKDYFSNNMADLHHNPSTKSCLLRIPNTINSKYGNKVEIVHEGDGKSIHLDYIDDIEAKGFNHILLEFKEWLIQLQINNKINDLNINKKFKYSRNTAIRKNKIEWIEKSMNIPITDFRYYSLWKILIPYLVNIRGIQEVDDIHNILKLWLEGCNQLRKLSYEPHSKINGIVKKVGTFLPMGQGKLKFENYQLFKMLEEKGCFRQTERSRL